MSNDQDKAKHGKRLQRAWRAIKRQLKIAKAYGNPTNQPHRYDKQHAMDCGQPECVWCRNPRYNKSIKGKDKLTTQEKRNNQKAKDE